MTTMTDGTAASVSTHVDISWKPLGRGRRFDRLRRGLARRMRLPFVQSTIRERDNPSHPFHAASYGNPWTSDHCLANFSFACTCHKRERYDRRRGR